MLGTKDLTGLGNSRAAQDKPGTSKLKGNTKCNNESLRMQHTYTLY